VTFTPVTKLKKRNSTTVRHVLFWQCHLKHYRALFSPLALTRSQNNFIRRMKVSVIIEVHLSVFEYCIFQVCNTGVINRGFYTVFCIIYVYMVKMIFDCLQVYIQDYSQVHVYVHKYIHMHMPTHTHIWNQTRR
jgi:hypothetical protein